MKKTLVVEGIWGIILPSYIEIIMNHEKDPYQPSSIMESRFGFLFVTHMYLSRCLAFILGNI